jgi:hypothetical protein
MTERPSTDRSRSCPVPGMFSRFWPAVDAVSADARNTSSKRPNGPFVETSCPTTIRAGLCARTAFVKMGCFITIQADHCWSSPVAILTSGRSEGHDARPVAAAYAVGKRGLRSIRRSSPKRMNESRRSLHARICSTKDGGSGQIIFLGRPASGERRRATDLGSKLLRHGPHFSVMTGRKLQPQAVLRTRAEQSSFDPDRRRTAVGRLGNRNNTGFVSSSAERRVTIG